ncbi:MAG: hypothetical protein IKT83_03565 [Bacteroidaceae bacterium]|nr:hypothetical protein [Bacteroidaceae bacterium]
MKNILTIIMFMMAVCAHAQNIYIGSFYVTSTEEESLYGDGNNKWTKRMPVICDMFNFEQPDILGLQSLTTTQQSSLVNRMTNFKAVGDILYNKTTIEPDTFGIVDEMPEGSICSWAKFKAGDKAFYVFNMHLTTDSNVAASSASRIRIAAGDINTENLPYFIIGNLGVNETKAAYTRLTSKFKDCYTESPAVSAEYGTVNNFDLEANHANNRYDFIFASSQVTIKAYGQLQYGYFTQESDGSHKRRLPSTHFPVMAKVTLP